MEFTDALKNKRLRGKEGEAEAVLFLENKGFEILERNFGKRKGEIDIIAEDENKTLVFIEVKTAFYPNYGDPAFLVNKKKQKTIGKVAEIYLAEKNLRDIPCRFDVVTVIIGKGKKLKITHYENAFMLTY